MVILHQTKDYTTFINDDGDYQAQIGDNLIPLVLGPEVPIPGTDTWNEFFVEF